MSNGRVEAVDRLHRNVDRGVEAEREVGARQIVVDGLGHADNVDSELGELCGHAEGVFAANRDQCVTAMGR